jgi:AcrR family transcriptional regulator
LEESGFGKLSIEGIAARAGVGKATIYRWWPNKGTVAMEAFLAAVSPTIAFSSTASARADLLEQVHKASAAYRGAAGRIVREMISLGQSDSETRRLFVEGYLEPRRSSAKEVLRRGVAQGEFRADIDLDLIVDAIYGPMFHRMLNGHGSIGEAFVEAHMALILFAIAAQPAIPDPVKA